MKTIIWDPGMIPFRSLSDLIDSLIKNENRVHIVTEQRRKGEWQSVNPRCHLKTYQEFEAILSRHTTYEEKFNFLHIYKNIIDDHRTLLIAERILSSNAWHSVFNNTRNIEIMVYNSLIFLEDTKPDFLLFQATPHALNSWILGKVAEDLGIPVYMIQTSPVPWRFWMVEGIDKQNPIFPEDQSKDSNEDSYLNIFLEKNLSSYTSAIPSYEKKRIDSRRGKFWSWRKELKDCAKHPSLVKSLFKKRKLYEVYNSLTRQHREVNTKRVVFFMHYQPERTSLPEGKWFSQQWLIIRALATTLPNGWRLLVKEHPSIFMGKFNWRYRHPQFYHDIASLPNVDLISIEEDTFELIDDAEAIVTITGTVGIQSLIRGTPVFLFGYGSYRKAYGVFEIQDLGDLQSAFRDIPTLIKEKVANETKQYLKRIIQLSVSALNNSHENVDIYGRDVRVQGNIKLLKMFFESMKLG